jgi:hypothetical protein
MITLEEAQAAHDKIMAVFAKFPEARAFSDFRKKWSAVRRKAEELDRRAQAARAKEEEMFAELRRLKDALPAEVREALCREDF